MPENAHPPLHDPRLPVDSLRLSESRRMVKINAEIYLAERFTHMIRQLNDRVMAHLTDNGTVLEAFAVTNGLKHGCVLTPILLIFMLPATLMDAYRDERPGIHISSGTQMQAVDVQKGLGIWISTSIKPMMHCSK
ncbi:unnamed protein product [Dibothriocephalus latus]|uniref:Reverse transcriptase domain-containing protein n=1 Tax=Dibothriocephalus latus TaxID=60516 RepID=A0A3P7NZC4_DIBLA|nr:unnamed protein product [Dibothriocephalus latus]